MHSSISGKIYKKENTYIYVCYEIPCDF